MMAVKNKSPHDSLTKVEGRMMSVLQDGNLHTPLELHGCLEDELGPVTNIHVHLSNMRDKIRPTGHTIVFHRIDGATFYQIVRLVISER